MFEVGFTEIILILGLALLVLGPEKLPGLAEKIGRWTGRARSMARQLRSQLEQEVTIEQMAKSKPMQPAPPPDRSPSAPSAGAHEGPVEPTPAMATPDPSPPGGIDFDKHFDEYDTTPEAMHRKPVDPIDTSPEAMHGTPVDPIDTTPEAMHGTPKDRVDP